MDCRQNKKEHLSQPIASSVAKESCVENLTVLPPTEDLLLKFVPTEISLLAQSEFFWPQCSSHPFPGRTQTQT